MRVNCIHGYFIFREEGAGETSDLMSLYSMDLVPKDDYFTFEILSHAPSYSVKGSNYLGAVANKTFQGKPWQVMRANNLVYDFINRKVLPISEVQERFSLPLGKSYYFNDGLLLPGSVMADGSRVKDYSAWYSWRSSKFRYSEVNFG